MIAFPAGAKVWIAGGTTDMRCGMNSLALKVQQILPRDCFVELKDAVRQLGKTRRGERQRALKGGKKGDKVIRSKLTILISGIFC